MLVSIVGIVYFLWSISFTLVRSEFYTALADLEELLYTESYLITALDDYIKEEKQRIELLDTSLSLLRHQHNVAIQDSHLYVSNPLNAYSLVKRLTVEWKQLETIVDNDLSEKCLMNITQIKETMKFPSEEDLNGAAIALTRLQDTYRLDTSSLARGELNGVKYSAKLSAADCFELGRQAYNNEDFYHALLWMREADAQFNKEINKTVDRSDILEYLAFSTYKQGNIPLALDLTNKLLEILPSHSRALGNRVYYEEELQKRHEIRSKGDIDYSEELLLQQSGETPYAFYERLCRGEVNIDPEITSQLKCKYIHRNNPFLRLARFKVEQAYVDPDIFIFHDVLSDREIEVIKRLAQPRFQRATVQNSKTGELEVAHYRISKSAWLKEDEDNTIKIVSQRVSDMTGLTMSTSEDLQVVNYGIGGHYEPHFDFARQDEKNAFKTLGTGNRIATVLFYMSDVEQGGATVFPNINVALWPKKGTAAFWNNLHSSGEGDKRTRHAACPVLAGSKWVANKWIHEQGQEFLRPCGLQRPSGDIVA